MLGSRDRREVMVGGAAFLSNLCGLPNALCVSICARQRSSRSRQMIKIQYFKGLAKFSLVILLAVIISQSSAQTPSAAAHGPASDVGSDITDQSEMRSMIEYYVVDRASLQRSYPLSISPDRRERFRKFYMDALERIQKLDFDRMSQEGKVDYILFRNHLEHELRQLDIEEKQLREVQPLMPFAPTIIGLEEDRRRMQPMDSAKTASVLNNLKKQIEDTQKSVEASLPNERRGGTTTNTAASQMKPQKTVAYRALGALNILRNALRNWYTFYHGYDPIFTWWNEEPYKALDQSLASYSSFLTERVVGIRTEAAQTSASGQSSVRGGEPIPAQGTARAGASTPRAGDTSDIVGDPIGREALLSELQSEMIPYTPEELIGIANKEMAWCENEMKKAARELGYGDDWRKALEHVKNQYVDPGKQPQMIRDLALEAIKFVDEHDLVTVPQLARDTWRNGDDDARTPAR